MRLLLFSLIFFLTCSQAYAWDARVVAVTDGDTITVEPATGGKRVKVRLYGIDSPESRQPYGQAAKSAVIDTALYKAVDIQTRDKDRYGRIVAIVGTPGGDTLQEILLDAGLAWVYPQYCRGCSGWYALEEGAKEARRGLWRDGNPVPPWVWRRGK